MDGVEVMLGMFEVGFFLLLFLLVFLGVFFVIFLGYEKVLFLFGFNCELNEGYIGYDGILKGVSGSFVLILLVLVWIFLLKKVIRLSFGKFGCFFKLCMNYFKISIVKWDDVY